MHRIFIQPPSPLFPFPHHRPAGTQGREARRLPVAPASGSRRGRGEGWWGVERRLQEREMCPWLPTPPPPARSPATPGHPLAFMPSWPVSEQRGSQSSPDESSDPWLLILAPAPSPPGPLTPPLGGPDFFLLRLSRFTRAEDPRARGQVQGRSRVWRSGRLRTRPAPGQDAEPRRAARVRAGAEARAAAPPAPQPPASAPRRP